MIELNPFLQLVSLTDYAVPCALDDAPKELREFLGLPPVAAPQCACANTGYADL